MRRGLYTRLAITNIKKNKQFYLPYLLTGMLTVAMYYIMLALQGNPGWEGSVGGADIKMIMSFGSGVIAVFAAIFLFYTNSFIIKRRKRELGIYNILGMEKKHLSKIMMLEAVITAVITVASGLAGGIVFNKLMCMLLYRMMGFDAGIDFYISLDGVCKSFVLFAAIYMLTLFYNMLQIKLANPIELLRGSNVGEREPKTKWLLTLMGIGGIGAGYYIAITTQSPLEALSKFFLAVMLVIIGTYCLFTAGSIALLKLMRKKKSFYYKSRHFTAVSGMLYRMKQNAVGLANICILSTMVLVMVSTTVSMYVGIEDELNVRYPSDILINVSYDREASDIEQIRAAADSAVSQSGAELKTVESYKYLPLVALAQENRFIVDGDEMNFSSLTLIEVVDRADYKELTGETVEEFDADKVVLASQEEYPYDTFFLDDIELQVHKTIITEAAGENMYGLVEGFYYLIVNDSSRITEIIDKLDLTNGGTNSPLTYQYQLNLSGSKEQKEMAATLVNNAIWEYTNTGNHGYTEFYCESRQQEEASIKQFYGGLLFLGMFLGVMFLMITVLIIFYKQISEGYDDKERFAIMEKVGMSNAEVKATIASQVRIVFFLPILTAAVHVAAAFPMICRLLVVLNLNNTVLFGGCLVGTIVVFAIIYLIVFLLTSKSYYRIVGNQV